MVIDYVALAIWMMYSLAFFLSVAILYYLFIRSSKVYVTQEQVQEEVVTPYFITIRDEEAEASVLFARELVERDPKKALDLAMRGVEKVLDKACIEMNIERGGGIEDMLSRLKEAGMVFRPEFYSLPKLVSRPKEFVEAVLRLIKYLKEAPIKLEVKAVENSSL
jgi:hypothetical protein